jgi:hypothetical protein
MYPLDGYDPADSAIARGPPVASLHERRIPQTGLLVSIPRTSIHEESQGRSRSHEFLVAAHQRMEDVAPP